MAKIFRDSEAVKPLRLPARAQRRGTKRTARSRSVCARPSSLRMRSSSCGSSLLDARPDGDEQAATLGQLIDERGRHRAGRGADQDGGEGRGLGPAGAAVADAQVDVRVARRGEGPRGARGQGRIQLDAVGFGAEFGQQGGLVAGARAHFQHALTRRQLGLLQHQAHDVGLADRLLGAQGQGAVRVGLVLPVGGDEGVAGQLGHGGQHAGVREAAPDELFVHHPPPRVGEIHGLLPGAARRACTRPSGPFDLSPRFP